MAENGTPSEHREGKAKQGPRLCIAFAMIKIRSCEIYTDTQ